MYTLTDGIYDTCPKYGPQIYMPKRQVIVKNNSVKLVNDSDGYNFSWSCANFFSVNNIWDKEKNSSHFVEQDKNYIHL